MAPTITRIELVEYDWEYIEDNAIGDPQVFESARFDTRETGVDGDQSPGLGAIVGGSRASA